jgi:hypothetical protein
MMGFVHGRFYESLKCIIIMNHECVPRLLAPRCSNQKSVMSFFVSIESLTPSHNNSPFTRLFITCEYFATQETPYSSPQQSPSSL